MAAQLNLRQQTGSSAPQQQQQQGPASDPVRPFDYKDLYPLVSDFANTSVQQHTVSEKQERVDKAMNLKADYANYPHRNPALNVRIDHDIEQLKSERDAATMEFEKLKLRAAKTCKSIFDLAIGRPLDSHHADLSRRLEEVATSTSLRVRDMDLKFEAETLKRQDLRDDFKKLSSTVTGLRDEVREQNKRHEDDVARVTDRATRLDKQMEAQARLLADVKEAARQATATQERQDSLVSMLQSEVGGVGARVNRVEETITQNADQLRALKSLTTEGSLANPEAIAAVRRDIGTLKADRAQDRSALANATSVVEKLAKLENDVANVKTRIEARAKEVAEATAKVFTERVEERVTSAFGKRVLEVEEDVAKRVEEGVVKRVKLEMEEDVAKRVKSVVDERHVEWERERSERKVQGEAAAVEGEVVRDLKRRIEEMARTIGEMQALLGPVRKTVLKPSFAEKVQSGFETYMAHLSEQAKIIDTLTSDIDALKSTHTTDMTTIRSTLQTSLASFAADMDAHKTHIASHPPTPGPAPATPTNPTTYTPPPSDLRVAQLEEAINALRHELETQQAREVTLRREMDAIRAREAANQTAFYRDLADRDRQLESVKHMIDTVVQYVGERLPPSDVTWVQAETMVEERGPRQQARAVNGRVVDAVVGK